MKKPINRFSIVPWVIAGLYLIITFFSAAFLTSEIFISQKTQGDRLIVGTMVGVIGSGIFHTSLMAAFGYIVELLDQIRWSLRPAQRAQ